MRPEVWAEQCTHARKGPPTVTGQPRLKDRLVVRLTCDEHRLPLRAVLRRQARPRGRCSRAVQTPCQLQYEPGGARCAVVGESAQGEEQVLEYANLTRLRSIAFGKLLHEQIPDSHRERDQVSMDVGDAESCGDSGMGLRTPVSQGEV